MLGISYRGKKPEKEGLKKQLNNVKPGLLNGEIETGKIFRGDDNTRSGSLHCCLAVQIVSISNT